MATATVGGAAQVGGQHAVGGVAVRADDMQGLVHGGAFGWERMLSYIRLLVAKFKQRSPPLHRQTEQHTEQYGAGQWNKPLAARKPEREIARQLPQPQLAQPRR